MYIIPGYLHVVFNYFIAALFKRYPVPMAVAIILLGTVPLQFPCMRE